MKKLFATLIAVLFTAPLFAATLGTIGAAVALIEEYLTIPLVEQSAPLPEAQTLPDDAVEDLPPDDADGGYFEAAPPDEVPLVELASTGSRPTSSSSAEKKALIGYDYDSPAADSSEEDHVSDDTEEVEIELEPSDEEI